MSRQLGQRKHALLLVPQLCLSHVWPKDEGAHLPFGWRKEQTWQVTKPRARVANRVLQVVTNEHILALKRLCTGWSHSTNSTWWHELRIQSVGCTKAQLYMAIVSKHACSVIFAVRLASLGRTCRLIAATIVCKSFTLCGLIKLKRVEAHLPTNVVCGWAQSHTKHHVNCFMESNNVACMLVPRHIEVEPRHIIKWSLKSTSIKCSSKRPPPPPPPPAQESKVCWSQTTETSVVDFPGHTSWVLSRNSYSSSSRHSTHTITALSARAQLWSK